MMTPSLEAVRLYAQSYPHIPVYDTLPYDGKKAEDIFVLIKGRNACFFESNTSKEHYTYLIYPCEKLIKFAEITKEILPSLEAILCEKSPRYAQLPTFTGGWIGHFNYETIRLIEKLPDHHLPSFQLPLIQLGYAKKLILIDHRQQLVYFIYNLEHEEIDQQYRLAAQQLEEMKQLYLSAVSYQPMPITVNEITSNLSKKAFEQMVVQAKAHIRQGDIFQIVLSQRFSAPFQQQPYDAFLQLRKAGASPYQYFLEFDDYVIAGVSPEILLEADQNALLTVPIAGTRKRGKNKEEDERLANELLLDPKENAEHTMLVDLGRNDLGKVSEIASVKVRQYRKIQKYSHVMHLISEVQATLRKDQTLLQALCSLLPAGTLSGAPKIRAMELIEELEPCKREVYGGVIAMLGFNQYARTCITIRTMLFHQQKVYIQAGAGIVKDSIPEKEYQETLQKAAAILSSLGHEVHL